MSACVLLVEGTSVFSRVIKDLTGSPYSHCALAFDRRWTVEADVGGVLSREVKPYPWPYTVYRIPHFDTHLDAERRMRAWATARLGARYDYGKVISHGVYLWLRRKFAESKLLAGHLTGIRPILDYRRAFYCAELVWEALNYAGVPLQTKRALVVPGDFALEPALKRWPPGEVSLLRGRLTGG